MQVAYTLTDKSVNLLLDGRMRTLSASHANFRAVREVLRDIGSGNWPSEALDALRKLVDIPAFIALVTEGRVQANGSEVRFDRQPVHGHIAERIMALLREGHDVRPIVRFLDRAKNNPFQTAIDEMYGWLEKSNMPLTPDGCFLAYKFVDADYKDNYSHTIDNRVGAIIAPFDPATVNTNRNQTCADSGYHFCSWGYTTLAHYPHVMIVKVAPENVTSFPSSEEGKGRCLVYEVVDEVPQDELKDRYIESRQVAPEYVSPPPDLSPEEEEAQDEREDFNPEDDVPQPPAAPEALKADFVTTKLPEPTKEKAARVFRNSLGRKVSAEKISHMVGTYGQRAAAIRLLVPRSTLQVWLKEIAASE